MPNIINETNTTIPNEAKIATFAGGCFWCMEPPFEALDGVYEVVSGYAGGEEENPTYQDVGSGQTGHVETVNVYYNPEKITYNELLKVFWKNIDPTDEGGQFADRGREYRTVIFYHDEEQKVAAEQSKKNISQEFDEPIVTTIEPFTSFYRAEEYHQDYYKKNEARYNIYKKASGREGFIKDKWEKPMKDELKETLTPIQYKVTQEEGTEPAFDNEYWNNTEEGLYVDIVSGEPLFSSQDKYKSGTGWPSFTKPLSEDAVTLHEDKRLFTTRTEVRSKEADSHLGHVFNDGPEPTGKRYCMNSAALRFIPKEKLEEEGYGEYLTLFTE